MKFALGLIFFLLAGFPVLAQDASTNFTTSASTNATREVKYQVWDFSDELHFSAEQKSVMESVRSNYLSAEKIFHDGIRATNVTMERKRELRRGYLNSVSNENVLIEKTLTPDQKKAYADLKKTALHSVRNARIAKEGEHAAASDAEYEKKAATLRAQYSEPATNWPKATIDPGVEFVELGSLPEIPFPKGNPYSTNKAALGRMLFFDPRMSASRQIACASCHDPDLGWADGRTVGFGHERKELKRNVPTILNAGLLTHLFWDGRADSLEKQVHDVLLNQDEMLGNESVIQDRLGKMPGYQEAFTKAFGDPKVSVERIAQAVATFERTIVSRRSAFELFLQGETNALSDAAVRGLNLFRTSARCANCHNGPTFSDGKFHNEGLSYYGRKYEDLGRYNLTKKAEDVGAFKTPTLRNVTRTSPYMHNGLFELEGVLRLYNAGMPTLTPTEAQKNDPLFPVKSKLLQPLHLNAHDLADLKAFLESLEETRFRMRPPEMPAEVAAKK